MKNVILADFQPNEDWHFLNGLENASGLNWERKIKVNNNQRGKFAGIKRYLGYFFYGFHIFLHRKKYGNIFAWQQFYGLIFAFFCRLFHVKKRSNLFIMIFIYIPKKGLKGKIYFKFIHYILTSKYIDKIFLFSSSEINRYSEEFNISPDKFVFMPFGDDSSISSNTKCDYPEGFIFSSGYSNRDFQFLVTCLKDTHYTVRIFGKENKIENNIICSDEFVGDKLPSIMAKTKLVVVPLKENRESGQFTIIHAMEFGIPVIATDTDCMKDYIMNGVNGFVIPNDAKLWKEKIDLLFSNSELYKKMSNNCKKIYEQKHTETALGNNIGAMILDYLKEVQ